MNGSVLAGNRPSKVHPWLQLLRQPGTYFDTFDDSAPSWRVAYLGFYLMTFVESVGNRAFGDVALPVGTILGQSLPGSLGAAIQNAIIYGILWLWVGSRLVRGSASLATTAKACGYAFLWPSLLGLLTVPLILWLSDPRAESSALVLLFAAALQLVAGLWALGVALLAVKHINGFRWGKTIIVAIWLPGPLVALVLGLWALS